MTLLSLVLKHLSTAVYNSRPVLVCVKGPFKRLQWVSQIIKISITYNLLVSGAMWRIPNNLPELKKLSTGLRHELSTELVVRSIGKDVIEGDGRSGNKDCG
jgi:hypothetical protein